MGNCITGTAKAQGRNPNAFSPTNTGEEVVHEQERRRDIGRKNRGALQSIIRVGSFVLRADPFDGNKASDASDHAHNGGTNGHLEQHKASTYDHVHQMVSVLVFVRGRHHCLLSMMFTPYSFTARSTLA
jgi:hypothetical protein